jgi:Sec7-like guanine-nucleotide exchange factor
MKRFQSPIKPSSGSYTYPNEVADDTQTHGVRSIRLCHFMVLNNMVSRQKSLSKKEKLIPFFNKACERMASKNL